MVRITALFAFICILSGCTDTVTSGMIERAIESCKEKNGIDFIDTFHFPLLGLEIHSDYTVTCKSRVKFKLQ